MNLSEPPNALGGLAPCWSATSEICNDTDAACRIGVVCFHECRVEAEGEADVCDVWSGAAGGVLWAVACCYHGGGVVLNGMVALGAGEA